MSSSPTSAVHAWRECCDVAERKAANHLAPRGHGWKVADYIEFRIEDHYPPQRGQRNQFAPGGRLRDSDRRFIRFDDRVEIWILDDGEIAFRRVNLISDSAGPAWAVDQLREGIAVPVLMDLASFSELGRSPTGLRSVSKARSDNGKESTRLRTGYQEDFDLLLAKVRSINGHGQKILTSGDYADQWNAARGTAGGKPRRTYSGRPGMPRDFKELVRRGVSGFGAPFPVVGVPAVWLFLLWFGTAGDFVASFLRLTGRSASHVDDLFPDVVGLLLAGLGIFASYVLPHLAVARFAQMSALGVWRVVATLPFISTDWARESLVDSICQLLVAVVLCVAALLSIRLGVWLIEV